MVTTRKTLFNVVVEVTYNYDVDVKVINDIISHNNYNKAKGNK